MKIANFVRKRESMGKANLELFSQNFPKVRFCLDSVPTKVKLNWSLPQQADYQRQKQKILMTCGGLEREVKQCASAESYSLDVRGYCIEGLAPILRVIATYPH